MKHVPELNLNKPTTRYKKKKTVNIIKKHLMVFMYLKKLYRCSNIHNKWSMARHSGNRAKRYYIKKKNIYMYIHII